MALLNIGLVALKFVLLGQIKQAIYFTGLQKATACVPWVLRAVDRFITPFNLHAAPKLHFESHLMIKTTTFRSHLDSNIKIVLRRNIRCSSLNCKLTNMKTRCTAIGYGFLKETLTSFKLVSFSVDSPVRSLIQSITPCALSLVSGVSSSPLRIFTAACAMPELKRKNRQCLSDRDRDCYFFKAEFKSINQLLGDMFAGRTIVKHNGQKNRQTKLRQKLRKPVRQTDRRTDRQTDRQKENQTDGRTNRQPDRKKARQTDRQAW